MKDYKFEYFCAGCNKSDEYRQANCIHQAKIKSFKRGEYISYKGDKVTNLMMLTCGEVAVGTILDSGVWLITITHKAPYPLGAVALFASDNRYRVDNIAKQDCTLAIISREQIEQQMVRCQRFMRNFIGYNATKVDTLARHLALLSNRSIRGKLAFYILSVREGNNYDFGRNITELATYFCVERPSLSRAIAQLCDEGIITHRRGRGEIIDASALKELIA